METRTLYHNELAKLVAETLVLGELAADAIETAVRQLVAFDRTGASRLIDGDARINERRMGLERALLQLIATQQPVARDIRLVAAMLDIAGELERIGDYAKGIATIQLKLDTELAPGVVRLLDRMVDSAVSMLRSSLTAFEILDAEAARRIVQEDDVVDGLFRELFAHVMHWGGVDDAVLERANYVLWIAHNIERTADRVTNICERVVFTATGDQVDLDPS